MPSASLEPILIDISNPLFNEIKSWQFADPFVLRLLTEDIPQRVQSGLAQIWIYKSESEGIIGFGTIDICKEYSEFTGNKLHPYIPLLAVHPNHIKKGYGSKILNYLIAESAFFALQTWCSDILFLDVYESSLGAIRLYEKHQFVKIEDLPRTDPLESQRPYFIMAKRVSIEQN